MNQQSIRPLDKASTAVVLACFLWVMDTSMTVCARASNGYFILIGLFVFSIILPFLVARRLFQIGPWPLVPHEPIDRIFVVIYAATAQLALEAFGLQVFSPGKLAATISYAVICSFAAVSSYKSLRETHSGTIERNSPEDEWKAVRRRLGAASIALSFCAKTAESILSNRQLLGLQETFMLLLLLVVVASSAYFFCFYHGRCPRCGARVSLRRQDEYCAKCYLR